MIDTIILRIHDLIKYPATVNILNKGKSNASTQFFANKKTVEDMENKQLNSIFYHGSDHIDLVNHRNTMTIPSSHYELAYKIDFKADYIEFNFSIPKYKWGSNLFQFISYYIQDPRTDYKNLMNFIQSFKQRLMDNISDYDIEINRLDFCYNQFFVTKEELSRYMEIQEKAFEKKARSSGSFKKYGKETLMLVTDRYSFKTYHKGPEFRKNDYRKLSENNKKSLDLQKMVQIADRTLRYELTVRSSYMFYQWKQIYIEGKKRVKLKSVYTYLYRALRIHMKKNIPAKKFFVKSEYDNWKLFQNEYGKQWPVKFMNNHNVTFTYELFNALYKEFWKHVHSVQIKTSSINSVPIIKKRISQYNSQEAIKTMLGSRKAPIKNANRLLFYFDISQRTSLKRYMQRGMMSNRTYQRIMIVFKRLNLGDYNPAVNLATPSLGFQDYKYYFPNYVV